MAETSYRQVGWLLDHGPESDNPPEFQEFKWNERCVPVFVAEAVGVIEPADPTDDEVSSRYVRQPCPAHCGAQGIFVTDKRNYWCEQCGAIGKFVSATIDSAPNDGVRPHPLDNLWPESTER